MARNARVTLSAESEIKLALACFFFLLLAADLLSIYSLVQTRQRLVDESRLHFAAALHDLSSQIVSAEPDSRPSEAMLSGRLQALGMVGNVSLYDADGSLIVRASFPGDQADIPLLVDRLPGEELLTPAAPDASIIQIAELRGKRYFIGVRPVQLAGSRAAGHVRFVARQTAGRLFSDQIIAAFQIAIVFVCLPFIAYFSRWMTLPYREVAAVVEEHGIKLPAGSDIRNRRSLTDAFRGIVDQLRVKEHELERLNLLERRKAQSYETLSGRIVESIPSGLIGFDREGRTIISNEQAHRIFQIRSLGSQAADADSFSTFFRSSGELAAMLKETLASGRTFRYRELEATIGTLGRRTLGVSVWPIGRGYADIQGAMCLVSDVTEINELRERVRVREYLSSLGEMSAGIAHEFKNSLATIHGFAQLLQSQSYNAETHPEIAASVMDETRNLTQMVTDFLNFARPQEVEFLDVDLAELISECREELAPLMESKRINFRAAGELPAVRGDFTMLRHAFLNLLRNAIDAIPDESDDREIRLQTRTCRTAEGQDSLEVEISDTGSGIEPENLSKIFVPFFTTKSKGHGIGLAIVQKIFSGHNGSIHAKSTPGSGATFTCRIPLSSRTASTGNGSFAETESASETPADVIAR